MFEKNEKIVFDDGEYVVWSDFDIEVGDEIGLTTSEFEYDALEKKFENNLQRCFSVEVEILEEDLTNFIAEKSCNGGGYGFATAKVLKVEEVI